MRTFETRISIDETEDKLLSNCAELYSLIEHKLFAAYSRGEKLTDLKSSYIKKYAITARFFNGIRITLEGKIASRLEHQKNQKEDLSHKIKALQKTTNHQKKRRLAHLRQKQINLTQDIENKKARITFGSNKLFRAQFHLKENNFASHSDWLETWKKQRANYIFFIGSKDETSGNQSCGLTLREDGLFDLRIRLPDALKSGKYLTLNNINFSYGAKELIQALEKGHAISFRFLKDAKGWRLFATTSITEEEPISLEAKGSIGIDINVNHIALVEIDRHGNYVAKKTYPYHVQGKSKHQIRAQIGEVSKAIVDYAKQTEKPIILEKLDFTKKRALLREQGPKLARKLSSYTYSSILTHIQSRSAKEKVKVNQVNPAYTSIIGKVKFAHRYGLSIHHSAALAIARRYYGFSERPNSGQGIIPDGKGGHVTLSLPVRNRDEHVWRFWNRSSKKIQAALTAHFRIAKSKSESMTKPAPETENPSEVKGETPLCESLEALLV